MTHDAGSGSVAIEPKQDASPTTDGAGEPISVPERQTGWRALEPGVTPIPLGPEGVSLKGADQAPAWPTKEPPPADATLVDEAPSLRRQVHSRLLGLAYGNLVVGICTDLICVAVMTWMIAATVGLPALTPWLAAAAIQMAVRSGVWIAWRRASQARRRRLVWRYFFFASAVTMAALWAVAGTAFMHAVPPGQQVFLIALLLGVSAALMAAAAPQPLAAHCSFAIMGLPVAIGFWMSGQSHFQALGVLCVVYTGFMSIMARNYHQLLRRSVRSDLENSAMAKRFKAARIRAERANDAKSRFLANMSHELRTPLNAINGFSEMMKAGVVKPATVDRYQSYSELIHRSGTHLLDLINDILDLAKAEAGSHALVEESVDIVDLARECIEVIQPAADQAGVQLAPDIQCACAGDEGPAFAEIWADRRKMRQILLNLLSNALKFTPAGGEVSVACGQPDDGGFVLYVHDTGVGMSRTQVVEAMKPFTQVDEGYDKRYQGTGLGLPLTKVLVELHDGSLRLDSEKGRGTTACVWLPPTRRALQAEGEGEADADPGRGLQRTA